MDMMEEIRRCAKECFEEDDSRKIGRFLELAAKKTLLELQENYCASFDLNPSTCLNLTYHKHGDGKERGAALARLREEYECSGHETATSELPDFLPLVFEFLSICDENQFRIILNDYSTAVNEIGLRLKGEGSDYSLLFDVISGMTCDMSVKRNAPAGTITKPSPR